MKKTIVCLCLAAALLCGGCASRNDIRALREQRAEWIETGISLRCSGAVYRIIPVDHQACEPLGTDVDAATSQHVWVVEPDVPLLLMHIEGEWAAFRKNKTVLLFDGKPFVREDVWQDVMERTVDDVFRLYADPTGRNGLLPVGDEGRKMMRETLSSPVQLETMPGMRHVIRFSGHRDSSDEMVIFRVKDAYFYALYIDFGRETYLCRIPDKYKTLIENLCKK